MAFIFDYVWLVPLLPLIAAVANAIFGRMWGARPAGLLAVAAMGLAFLVTCLIFLATITEPHGEGAIVGHHYVLYPWINSGDFKVDVGFYIDQLSAAMMMLVTGVGWLINIYSLGYIAGDKDPVNGKPNEARFFTYMPLFAFAMLMLVMSDN